MTFQLQNMYKRGVFPFPRLIFKGSTFCPSWRRSLTFKAGNNLRINFKKSLQASSLHSSRILKNKDKDNSGVENHERGIAWNCQSTWKQASINTSWCLLGCSIGEFSTLAAFQLYYGDTGLVSPTVITIALPVINGLITSVALETAILYYGASKLSVRNAFKTAMGMSFISMVSMELAMEFTDFVLTGGMQMQMWAIAPMLFMGFITPLPFNYWRLKRYGKSCH